MEYSNPKKVWKLNSPSSGDLLKGRPKNEVSKIKKKNTTNFKNRHGRNNDVFVKKEHIKNFLRNFDLYQNVKNFEKKYLRTGNSQRKRTNWYGEVAEWLKAHAWKACKGETLSWVRIPFSPPSNKPQYIKLI